MEAMPYLMIMDLEYLTTTKTLDDDFIYIVAHLRTIILRELK